MKSHFIKQYITECYVPKNGKSGTCYAKYVPEKAKSGTYHK
jgi:hypothetical protein